MNLRNYAVQSYYDYATETFYCALLYMQSTDLILQAIKIWGLERLGMRLCVCVYVYMLCVRACVCTCCVYVCVCVCVILTSLVSQTLPSPTFHWKGLS